MNELGWLMRGERRSALAGVRRWACLLGCAALLAGCGAGDGHGGAAAVALDGAVAGADPAGAAEGGDGGRDGTGLRIFTWNDYLAPEVIEEFESRHGVEIALTHYGSTEEMVSRFESTPDAFDLVLTEDSEIARLGRLNLLLDLDRGAIPNLRKIDERHRDLPSDPGNRYSVPYLWGTTLVAYRKDRLEPESRSWNLLFRDAPEEAPLFMYDDVEETFGVALISLGYSLNSESAIRVREAEDVLHRQAERYRVTYGNDAEVKEAMDAGTCWAATMFSGDAAALAAENPNVGYYLPEEGAPVWVDSFVIARTTTSSDLAHEFLNFLCEPRISAINANLYWYATPVAEAVFLLEPELASDEAVFPPPRILERCEVYTHRITERERWMSAGMSRIRRTVAERERAEAEKLSIGAAK